MNTRSNSEATLSVQKHSVKKVAFACAIHSCYGNYADWTPYVIQKFHSFNVYFKLCKKSKE